MITYPQLGKLQNYLELQHFFIKEIQYTDQVSVICAVDEKSADHFKESIIELLNGQVQFEEGSVSITSN